MAAQEHQRQPMRPVRALESAATRDAQPGRHRAARLATSEPSVRAMSPGAILDFSVEILMRRFGALVGVATACWIPVEVLGELVLRYGSETGLEMLWVGLLAFPLQALTVSLVSSLVGGEVLGRPMGALDSLRLPLFRVVGVGVISVVTVLATLMGFCLGCIGMPVVMWLLAMAPAVYILEGGALLAATRETTAGGLGSDVVRALRRSAVLSKGWGGLARWLCYTVVGGLMIGPLSAFASAAEEPSVRAWLQDLLSIRGVAFSALSVLLSGLFVGAGYAYMAVNMAVFYFDRRVEREALDLELAIDRLGAARG